MTWTHIKRHLGMGLEEQWVFRPGVAPLCSLKKNITDGTWGASLLNLTGISSIRIECGATWSLEQAQAICESTLKEMGHTWPDAPRSTKKKDTTAWLGSRRWS